MDGFNIYDIGLGGVILVIIVLFMLVGFVKGLVRMFFGLVALAAGGLAAYWGFQRGDAIAGYMIADPDPWMAGAVGAILGLAVFFTARAIFNMVARPTKVIDGKKKNSPGFGGLLGIVGGLAFAAFLISGIRYLGTVSELAWLKQSLAEEGKVTKLPQPPLVGLRNAIDSTTPGSMHRDFDFLNNTARAQLAKLRIMADNKYAISMATGDANAMKAIEQHDIRSFLNDRGNDKVGAYIEENKFSHLLANEKIVAVCEVPEAAEVLVPLDLIKVLGMEPEKKKKPKKKADSKTKK